MPTASYAKIMEPLQHLNQQLENTQGQLLQSDRWRPGWLMRSPSDRLCECQPQYPGAYIATLLDLINTYEQVADELPVAVQQRLSQYRESIDWIMRQDVIELLAESAEGLDRVVYQIVQDPQGFCPGRGGGLAGGRSAKGAG